MSKPIIKFLQEPPIEINCQEETEVKLSVVPNAPGICKVVLSTLLQSCTFDNGEAQMTVEVECAEGETSVDCQILVKMVCAEPDEYFTLLMAKAINAEEQTSYQKPIEAIIKCQPVV
ncbi:MAG: hypothetical protein KDC34_16790 [Saprospiraceae bacterium]|nr:hypothetical protein [Saprospiraceae bacterium]